MFLKLLINCEKHAYIRIFADFRFKYPNLLFLRLRIAMHREGERRVLLFALLIILMVAPPPSPSPPFHPLPIE
jgi:hypothetical protein